MHFFPGIMHFFPGIMQSASGPRRAMVDSWTVGGGVCALRIRPTTSTATIADVEPDARARARRA